MKVEILVDGAVVLSEEYAEPLPVTVGEDDEFTCPNCGHKDSSALLDEWGSETGRYDPRWGIDKSYDFSTAVAVTCCLECTAPLKIEGGEWA